MHQAMGGERRLPAIGLVDALAACRPPRRADPPGPVGKPRRRAAERRAGGRLSPAGLTWRRDRAREGRLVAEAARGNRCCPAASAADGWRGRYGSRWNGPRCRAWHAWRPGRPIILSWRRPAQSVQAMSRVISCSKAAWASSAAMRRIVGGGNADLRRHAHRGRSADRDSARPAAGRPVVARRPSGSVNSPAMTGEASGAVASHGARRRCGPSRAAGRRRRARRARHRRRRDCASPARARWCSGRGNRDRSRSACSSSWIERRRRRARRCRARCPAIHRRWRNSRSCTGLTETNLAPRPFSLPRPILIGLLSWSSATPNIRK